ncbi:polysaccharide deacetylase family protein, partial [Streptomyces sp. SID5926]|nr:polysaccharide deacetylase family protein [Streptomyces sp. SID5926]
MSRASRATTVLAVAALAAGCAQAEDQSVRGAPGQQAPPAR